MKLRHIIFTLFSLTAACLLSGCHIIMLDPKGIIAADEKRLLVDAVLLMLIVVIPVIVLSFIFAWKYRAANKKAKYRPDLTHSVLLEAVWWAVPCVIIAILAVLTWVTTHRLDPYRPLDVKGKPITIQVVALDWKWLFIYPEQHIATVNYAQIPVNVPVTFLITADAPMNSFQIPQLAGQIYAMPGMRTQLHMMATSTGDYMGLSTNFSGDGFSGMHFNVRVSSQKEFNQWVGSVQRSSKSLTKAVYAKLRLPSENNAVESFSTVVNGLFQGIIMKYMVPMSDTPNT